MHRRVHRNQEVPGEPRQEKPVFLAGFLYPPSYDGRGVTEIFCQASGSGLIRKDPDSDPSRSKYQRKLSAPDTTSNISRVIAACRALL